MSGRRSPSTSGARHALLLCTFLVAFVSVAGRLVWVQAVAAPKLAEAAFNQRLKDIELPPRRGTIYDREGEPLAVTMEARTVFISPNQIKRADKEAVAQALADTLGGTIDEYREKVSKDSGFEYISRKVDVAKAEELEQLDLEGVGFLEDYRRMYPSAELACQVLGFVGMDDAGLAGIEKTYNDVLSGTPGVFLGERDRRGNPIPGGVRKEFPPSHGHDIVLTIDKDIQYESQVALSEAVKKWGAKSGSIIVMNPRNGEIYAMASTPGFSPNEYGVAKPDAIRNKPVSDAYEPGSTLKCLTAAAVIEQGLYTSDSMFELPSTIKVGGRTIHEAHGRASVRWSLTDIITHSSNIGTVKLGLKLKEKGLYSAFSDFGLTEKTGIDFPGEATGWLPKPELWSPSSIGNIPFGQGVSVTPMQLARSIGAIANDGELVTPHFLLQVPHDPDSNRTWSTRRAISADTAHDVTAMLEAVVTSGTGSTAAIPGYSVAGKTGTAQKALPNGGGYKGGGYVGSFIGYLPAEDPQVLVCVTIDQPRNAIYGGVVAAPTFARVGAFSVAHLKIPPSTRRMGDATGAGQGVGTVSKPVVND